MHWRCQRKSLKPCHPSRLSISERKPLEEKESYRRAGQTRERLPGVPVITVAQDREGDIYESYPILKEHDVNSRIGRTTTGRSARKEKAPG
jgi:hypothetical protein